MNINDFAKILCDDLELPATHFVPSIVQSIQTQLNEHPRYLKGFLWFSRRYKPQINFRSLILESRVENNHYFFDRMVKMVMVIGSEKKGMVGYGYGCITILTIITIFTIITIITIFGYNGYKMVFMVLKNRLFDAIEMQKILLVLNVSPPLCINKP